MISETIFCSLRVSLVLLTCAPGLFACLNPIGQDYMGDYISLDHVSGADIVKELNNHKDRAYWQDVLKQLLAEKRKRSDEYSANNHAVALAHLGRVKEAIAILLEIEREYPGMYATAANLGTAYELNGENENALKWIKEGFRRDKKGHSGSEWLHVKILETKLRLQKEPDWLNNNTVLNIQFDRETDPAGLHTTDHLGERQSLQVIESALVYQLHERLEFVKPPEPVVADLLADLSSIYAITRAPEDSRAIYDLAKSYGTARQAYLKPPTIAAEVPMPENWSVVSIAIAVASVFALLIGVGVAFRLFSRGKLHI